MRARPSGDTQEFVLARQTLGGGQKAAPLDNIDMVRRSWRKRLGVEPSLPALAASDRF